MFNDDLMPPTKSLAEASRRLKLGLPAPRERKRRYKPKRKTGSELISRPEWTNAPSGSPERREYMRQLARWSKIKPSNLPDIIRFCEDPRYLGLSLSPAQRLILKVIFGVPLDAAELPLFQQISGRTRDPQRAFRVVTIAAGARGGKTGFIMAPTLLWHALFGDHKPAVGEVIRIALVAQDLEAASVAFDYMVGYMERSPELRTRIVGKPLRRRMVVKNRGGYEVEIRTFPCTARSARAYSFAAAGIDEMAFFRFQEGAAAQDVEVEASIRRGMLSQKNPVLIKVSTPYAREGVLYRDVQEYFGRDDSDDVLVMRAPSGVLNPQISADRLAEEQRIMDPQRFAREYEAEFVDAATAWLSNELIEAAVDTGVTERAPMPGVVYVMAIDPSGGGKCGFALVVGHYEMRDGKRTFVHDLGRVWMKPKSGALDLRAVCVEVWGIAQRYNVTKVYSDRYAGQWPSQWLREISGGALMLTDPEVAKPDGSMVYLNKSAAFVEVGPHFRTGAVRLLDDPTLARELRNLEVRTGQAGRVHIGRPPARDVTDDLATALALSVAMAMTPRQSGAIVVSVTKRWHAGLMETAPSGREVPRWIDPSGLHPHERPEEVGRPEMSQRKRRAWGGG
jgi:hypothetical protein